jgi:NADPH2:quinone reductase
MRAIWLTEFGAPSVLVPGEAPDPTPAEGQVRVDVEAASVVFVETQLRAGGFAPPGGARKPPYIPGNGVGGVVGAVGPHVDPGLVGRRVVTTTGGSGGYAERVAVDADGLIDVPDAVTMTDAVALLADGRTALGLFGLAKPAAGEWVLIEAAAGGVGTLLVQLCLAAGARVIGAASNDRKLSIVRELKAEAVDYARPDWTDEVKRITGGEAVNVAFDGVGGEIGSIAASLTAAGSRFVVHGAASGGMTDATRAAQRGATVYGMRDLGGMNAGELSARALAEAVAGRLHPVIGQTYPLERAADAHATIEARRSVGKTLLLT